MIKADQNFFLNCPKIPSVIQKYLDYSGHTTKFESSVASNLTFNNSESLYISM